MSLRKIFYVPGLISALIIPVLFWYYMSPYIDETKYTAMDFGLPVKLKKDKSNLNSTLEPIRDWNYKKIIIDPGKAKENSGFYVSEVKKLEKRNEKIPGSNLFWVKIILTEILLLWLMIWQLLDMRLMDWIWRKQDISLFL